MRGGGRIRVDVSVWIRRIAEKNHSAAFVLQLSCTRVSISQPQADRRSQSAVSVNHAQNPRTEPPRWTSAGRPWVSGCVFGVRFRGWNLEGIWANPLACRHGRIFLLCAGPSREPFKIREQIKLEELDSDEDREKQPPLVMASNSIFENFPSYHSCFSRGEYPRRLPAFSCNPSLISFQCSSMWCLSKVTTPRCWFAVSVEYWNLVAESENHRSVG